MSAAGFLPAFVVRLDHSKLGFDSSPSKFLDVDLILKESPGYSAWKGHGSALLVNCKLKLRTSPERRNHIEN